MNRKPAKRLTPEEIYSIVSPASVALQTVSNSRLMELANQYGVEEATYVTIAAMATAASGAVLNCARLMEVEQGITMAMALFRDIYRDSLATAMAGDAAFMVQKLDGSVSAPIHQTAGNA